MTNTKKTPVGAYDETRPALKLVTLNQAKIIGTPNPAFDAILEREIEFMAGLMFGAGNRRNTQDEGWTTSKMTLAQLAHGFDKEGGAPAWGLSRHPVSKHKAGMCIVLGSSIGGARKAKAMRTMYLMGLDIDSGAKLVDVIAKIESAGLACFVSTTHTHGKAGLTLPRDNVLRKLGIKSDPTAEQVKEYLREHDKSNFEESFIEAVTIKADREQTKDGVVIKLNTPPLDKFRLFFPLLHPVKIIEQGDTHQDALDDWANCVTGLASMLDVNFDTSCTDPSRLFYTARHPAGAEFECYIVQGEPLDYATIPRASKASATADWRNRPDIILDSGFNVSNWHRTAKDRFMLADLLENECPDKIRHAGGERGGHVHTECPFEHDHTTAGGTGTMAVNCIDAQNEYWTWFCHHDACKARHKTELLAEAIRAGWFEESPLTSDEFMLPCDEDSDPIGDMRDDRAVQGSPSGGGTDKPRRQIADPLFDAMHLENGFVKGTGEKLDKRVNTIRYEMRAAMSELFEFVIMEGGEARALLKADNGQAHRYITKQALRDMFANRTVPFHKSEKKVEQIHPATEFMVDPLRKTYLGTQFEPDPAKVDPLMFNLWSGFAVAPVAGDWSKLRDHIRDQIIAGNESDQYSAEYLFNWVMTRYAHMFQFAGEKIGNAIVFKGEEGTGKTKLTEWLRRAVGVSAHKIAQRKHLVGNFNAGLDARIYVVSEEAFFSGDKEAAGVVKDMITDDRIEIEKKGYESVTRSNYIRPDFVSNEDWVVPTGENGDARRFLVLNVNTNRKQDKAFFKAIDAQMNSGGVEAMVHELMHWDPTEHGLEWSDLRTVPWTPARGEQATHGLSGPRARLKDIISVGVVEGRTAAGDSFYYDLSDTAETVVARTHLNAALTGGGKAFGGTGKKIQAAIEDMIGVRAASDTRSEVLYFESASSDDPTEKTTSAKTVTFPPLSQLSETIAQRYR